MTGEPERPFEGLHNPMGDQLRGVGAALDQDGELVTAEPGHGVAGFGSNSSSRLADTDQQIVADRMTEVVIDPA